MTIAGFAAARAAVLAGDFAPPLAIVRDALALRGPCCALDLGAGAGRNAAYLARRGCPVVAIDRDPRAVSALSARARLAGLSIDATALDLRAAAPDFAGFALVACTFVLHLLPPARATALLAEARAAAAPGTVHAIAAITDDGDFAAEPGAREAGWYPQRQAIAADYRAAGWELHRAYAERRAMQQSLASGAAAENLVAFVVARQP